MNLSTRCARRGSGRACISSRFHYTRSSPPTRNGPRITAQTPWRFILGWCLSRFIRDSRKIRSNMSRGQRRKLQSNTEEYDKWPWEPRYAEQASNVGAGSAQLPVLLRNRRGIVLHRYAATFRVFNSAARAAGDCRRFPDRGGGERPGVLRPATAFGPLAALLGFFRSGPAVARQSARVPVSYDCHPCGGRSGVSALDLLPRSAGCDPV